MKCETIPFIFSAFARKLCCPANRKGYKHLLKCSTLLSWFPNQGFFRSWIFLTSQVNFFGNHFEGFQSACLCKIFWHKHCQTTPRTLSKMRKVSNMPQNKLSKRSWQKPRVPLKRMFASFCLMLIFPKSMILRDSFLSNSGDASPLTVRCWRDVFNYQRLKKIQYRRR